MFDIARLLLTQEFKSLLAVGANDFSVLQW